jgi:putative ABC transport system ATP-binding protein
VNEKGMLSNDAGSNAAPRRPCLLRARDVTHVFGAGEVKTAALKDVSCEVAAGQLVLLTGPSGSGKTTLMSVMAGMLRPSAGDVELLGVGLRDLRERDVLALRRHGLGFVFQKYNLFPGLTALENVVEPLVVKGYARPVATERGRRVLDLLGLANRLKNLPAQLSGGQQQRVAIARALASRPAVIIGDEISASLDWETAQQVLGILRRYVGPDSAVLLVTHDLRLERYADRVLEMREGMIVGDRWLPRPEPLHSADSP